ncbi:hypothetical protein [Butyrivibrio sp. LC3010]|uniref:hypothetical protein n=1 Tax=Butyrivibrio sp. LC3010 TaxID=1280680 RepID=UPI0004280BE7|nr:hypothetical protein [Butyrivibrio sp. LC3010]
MHNKNHILAAVMLSMAVIVMNTSAFGMRSIAGPSEDRGSNTFSNQENAEGNGNFTATMPGDPGNISRETEVELSDFDWFLDNLIYDDFEKIYYYDIHPLSQTVTDKSKLEGTWDMVIYHHPDQTVFAPSPLFLGKEIGKLYIENDGDDNLKISMKITEAIPDNPGDTNPVDENAFVIDGFWNLSGIINANIEGGGSLDIYNFFTLPDENVHATGSLRIMTQDKSIYNAYLGLNKCDERPLRGDAANIVH